MRRFYHSRLYFRIHIPLQLALLAALAGPIWLGACPAFAAPAASQPAPTGASPQPATQPSEAEMIQLNLPKNLQVKTLVEYISQRMQMNILYDESLVKGTVMVNSPAKIPKDSLMDLFKGILKINGLVARGGRPAGLEEDRRQQGPPADDQGGGHHSWPDDSRPAAAECPVTLLEVIQQAYAQTIKADKRSVTGTATAANQLAAVRAVNGESLRSSRLRRGIFQFPKELLLERRVFQHLIQNAIRLAALDVVLERGGAGLGIERQAAQAAEPVDGGVLGLATQAGSWLHRAFDGHGIFFLDAVHPQQGVVHVPAAKVTDHLSANSPTCRWSGRRMGRPSGCWSPMTG